MPKPKHHIFETLVLAADHAEGDRVAERIRQGERGLILIGQGLSLSSESAYSILILQDLHESVRVVIEMSYKYTYPVIDRALRDFLIFLLMLLTVVAVAAAIGTVSGVDTSATDAQTMGVPVGVQGSVPAHAWEDIEQHAPTISTSLALVDSNENQEWDFYDL